MKKIFYFKCSSTGEVFERFIDDKEKVERCACGGVVVKQLSAPRYFSNTTGKSPAARY